MRLASRRTVGDHVLGWTAVPRTSDEPLARIHRQDGRFDRHEANNHRVVNWFAIGSGRIYLYRRLWLAVFPVYRKSVIRLFTNKLDNIYLQHLFAVVIVI